MMVGLAAAALLLAAIPALLFRANLRVYLPLSRVKEPSNGVLPALSVLIPARNEEATIGACVTATLANKGVDLEVLVLNDQSEDATGKVVSDLATTDPRVRLLTGEPPPDGWCGKQYACWTLARAARHSRLVFLDADVRLAPDALVRLSAFMDQSQAALVSGVPRQETVTLAERLVLPLIHFVLLGFLPVSRMRQSLHPSYGAGCGQVFLADQAAYNAMGGHSAIRSSLHDGIQLPRAFRSAGFRTDLGDLTEVARCRMYRTPAEIGRGLAKNATEGLASPRMILPATLLLAGGQVLPILLLTAIPWLPPQAIPLTILAVIASYYPRFAAARRFRQSWIGAFLHPVGIFCFLAIQWYAFFQRLRRRPSVWKGRAYVGERLSPQH